MFLQHAVQHPDTVFVAVPRIIDSVTVRLPAGVRISDTVRAVVHQTGGEWYLVGTLMLAAALLAVTYWAARLQGALVRLQATHEAERQATERKREEEHERAVDARISGIAYALRRQLRSWLDEAPSETNALIGVYDAWKSAVKDLGGAEVGDVPGVTPGMLDVTLQWAVRRSGEHFDRAEGRMLELVAAAPDASSAVAASIRRAYVLFYQATGRLNRQFLVHDEVGEADAEELATAYHEIEACVQALEPAIGEELRKADGELGA